MAPVAAFKGERVPSRRLGRREFASVSETTEMTAKNGVARRVRERTQIQVEVGDGPVITCLVQTDPFGEENSIRGRRISRCVRSADQTPLDSPLSHLPPALYPSTSPLVQNSPEKRARVMDVDVVLFSHLV